jgi:hypothetical protein
MPAPPSIQALDYCPFLHPSCKRSTSVSGVSGSVRDPDPQDPHVFGPPGSRSIIQRYGSGSISQRYRYGSGSFLFFFFKCLLFLFCTIRLPCNSVATLHFVLAELTV